MRRVALTAMATIIGLVLLLGFKSHGGPRGGIAALTVLSPPSASPSQSPASAAPTAPASQSAPKSTQAPTPSAQVRTVTGQAVDTRYGPVQVIIRVTAGRITQAGVAQVPLDTSRDRAINSYAVPQLDHEALTAQSAHIDAVSGASYTSQGYIASLQSALDTAGIR